MRFKAQIRNVSTFAKFCASLASLGQIAWCRLNNEDVRFTVIPEKGSQVWSVLKIESVFETYNVQSAAGNNINLEVPIQALQRALKSALGATSVGIRLTKKGNLPILSLTIVSNSFSSGNSVVTKPATSIASGKDEYGEYDFPEIDDEGFSGGVGGPPRERETIITQDIPVKVLTTHLLQVKSISERFVRVALATKGGSSTGAAPRLELSANMHGSFKIAIKTDALSISSVWNGLINPELDPSHFENGSQGIRDHPSVRMKELGGPNGENEAGWSKIRIDGRDWSRVLSVGRLGARVIACFMNGIGLILYVYPSNDDDAGEESCLTVPPPLIAKKDPQD